MDEFDEVRARLQRVNVAAPDYGNAHGVLSLAGDTSSIELAGDLPIADAPPPGWFDLRLRQANGRTIFVHNAVRTSMTFPSGSEARSAVLFPNMVVDDANGLDADNRVRTISFGLDGWNACFAYNYVETLDLYGSSGGSIRPALDAARYAFARDEPFAPHEVHVVNELGTLVDFEVSGRRHSIFAGWRTRFGSRDRLDAQVRLIGTVAFPEPVDLETATDACWDWRRYFNQMAMARMAFTGMAVAATTDPRSPSGNLYLPNHRRSEPRRRDRTANAYHMPLNQWHERVAAGEAMRSWLVRQDERRVFRAALDRVLARPGHVAIEDAVALCSGVETLPELSSREGLPRNVLQEMTEAAVGAAAASGIEVDSDRVRGLLGGLQNADLRRRLRRLAGIAAPEADRGSVDRWIEVLLPLRLFGAHGRTPATDDGLIAGPAVEALAGLCARFDLQDAGMPSLGANGARGLPTLQWQEAMATLEVRR